MFKRRYEVKTKYGPPFKMFLFIFMEASEKKNSKKISLVAAAKQMADFRTVQFFATPF